MKEEKCETCEWRSSEIGYASRCPAHEIKPMSSLKQFQEEGEKEFIEYWEKVGLKPKKPTIGNLDREMLLYWYRNQTTLAYELGKKEALEEVNEAVEEIRIQSDNERNWDKCDAIDSLKQKLLALNEE